MSKVTALPKAARAIKISPADLAFVRRQIKQRANRMLSMFDYPAHTNTTTLRSVFCSSSIEVMLHSHRSQECNALTAVFSQLQI